MSQTLKLVEKFDHPFYHVLIWQQFSLGSRLRRCDGHKLRKFSSPFTNEDKLNQKYSMVSTTHIYQEIYRIK